MKTATKGQLGLFGGLPFSETMGTAQALATVDLNSDDPPDDLDEWQDEDVRASGATDEEYAAFEDWLRSDRRPFVCVDEAKKAIFHGAHIGSFDFLVYRDGGPNLLVMLASSPSRDAVEALEEWERVFGPDFVAALIWLRRDDEWVGLPLAEWTPTENPAHARPLREWI